MRGGWWLGCWLALSILSGCGRSGIAGCLDGDDCEPATPAGGFSGGAGAGGSAGSAIAGGSGAGGGAGATAPCSCGFAPPFCQDDVRLVTYPFEGACVDGICQYTPTVTDCECRCKDGACVADRCDGIEPPDVVQISAGGEHTCGLYKHGTAVCWGSNSVGQLGNGSTSEGSQPTPVSGLTNLIQVSAGRSHTCAVAGFGFAFCWGLNRFGRLGDGTTNDSAVPVQVATMTAVHSVAAAGQHSCARLQPGNVVCWGNNSEGELGDGTTTESSVPVSVLGLSNVTSIVATGEASIWGHSCALVGESAMCWGYNGHGELGSGDVDTHLSPVPVIEMGAIRGIAVGVFQSFSITEAGDVMGWGIDGTTGTYRTVAEQIHGLSSVVAVAAGAQHACALIESGKVLCWGDNKSGVLGNGSEDPSMVPTEVLGLADAVEITAGSHHNCARVASGAVHCWGDNTYGQLGVPDIPMSSVPVAVLGL